MQAKQLLTTDEINMKSRLQYLERFILRMRLYLDEGHTIQPGSEAHGDLMIMTDASLKEGYEK